jgi:hypothetical protein
MITKIDLENDLIKILNPRIGFCPTNKKYYMYGKWANQIALDHMDEMAEAFERNLISQLSNFKDPKKLIVDFYETIWNKIEWYKNHNIDYFTHWESIKSKIKDIELVNVPYIEDRYTSEYVKNIDFENTYEDGNLFSVLHDIHHYRGGFSDETTLEKAKLINALQLHYETINTLYDALYKIEMDFEELNLDNYTNLNFRKKINSSELKCNINLSKIEVASLFRFLNETNLFYIDEINKTKNRSILIRFFEDNFNYCNEDGETLPITRLGNDLSKITLDNRLETQLNTLKHLEASLGKYIKDIEDQFVNNRKRRSDKFKED